MQQQTKVTEPGRASPISLRPIKDGIDELVTLYKQQEESAARCSDAIKATAEEAGLMANVVRKFVKARAGQKFGEAKRVVEQLSLVFEEAGDHVDDDETGL